MFLRRGAREDSKRIKDIIRQLDPEESMRGTIGVLLRVVAKARERRTIYWGEFYNATTKQYDIEMVCAGKGRILTGEEFRYFFGKSFERVFWKDNLESFFGENSSKYSVAVAWEFRRYGWLKEYPSVYVDAEYVFVLCCGKQAIAAIGFDVEENLVLVKQIQGVKDNQEKLRGFRWEKMLLMLVVLWAEKNGFSDVGVQRAEDNKWKNKVSESALKMRYDVTAQRCSFSLDQTRKFLVRKL